jgi:hypothetical protein
VQQIGSVAVSCRDAFDTPFDWFRDLPRANRVPHDYSWHSDPNAAHICETGDNFRWSDIGSSVVLERRSNSSFFAEVRIEGNEAGLRQIDPSFLPPTLVGFHIFDTPIRSGSFDFAALADACPRLEYLHLFKAGLKMEIDFEAVLPRFVISCNLAENDLCNNGAGIDFAKLHVKLRAGNLVIWHNPRLSGAVRGLRTIVYFDTECTQLTRA